MELCKECNWYGIRHYSQGNHLHLHSEGHFFNVLHFYLRTSEMDFARKDYRTRLAEEELVFTVSRTSNWFLTQPCFVSFCEELRAVFVNLYHIVPGKCIKLRNVIFEFYAVNFCWLSHPMFAKWYICCYNSILSLFIQ